MGYTAYTVESFFIIPIDKIPAALAAANDALGDPERGIEPGEFTSLDDAFAENTGFEEGGYEDQDGWNLGNHTNNYYDVVETLLAAVAPFANEGSVVRFNGECDELFGFRVINGVLESETGDYTWKVVPRTNEPVPVPVALAVTRYGEKLRDTHIGVTLFPSEDEARAALRSDFADELAESAEQPGEDRDLLDVLRWDHNVIAGITSITALQA